MIFKGIVWLCLATTSPEGSLLTGHDTTYSVGIQVHTTQMVSSGCNYYKLEATCESVYDEWDEQFRTTYLCEVD